MMEYDESIYFFTGCDDMIMLLRIRHHISRGAVLLFAAAEAKVIRVELRQHSIFKIAYPKGRSERKCCSVTTFSLSRGRLYDLGPASTMEFAAKDAFF